MNPEQIARAIYIARRAREIHGEDDAIVIARAFALLFWNDEGFDIEEFHQECEKPFNHSDIKPFP